MKRLACLAAAALAAGLAAPAAAQEVWGGAITLYDQYGNAYYGDPHSTGWYGTSEGGVYNDWYGTGAPADGWSYAPLTTENPWTADSSGSGYSYQPGDIWSPGRDYNE
jgi:opacity protein-like surface antigen